MSERSNEELMSAYCAGDQAAFRELFGRTAPMVQRVLRRGGFPQQVVAELAQQTFLQMHRARRDYQPGRPVKPWLAVIAMNVRRDYLRRRMRRPEGSTVDTEQDISELVWNAGGQERRVRAVELHAALAKLPDKQRTVIELHWLEGLPFPEVAQSLGLKTSAVKVRAHRGYKRLAQLLRVTET